jgi:hypothetical protein
MKSVTHVSEQLLPMCPVYTRLDRQPPLYSTRSQTLSRTQLKGAGRGLRLGSDAGVVAGSGFAAVLPEFF